MYIDWEDIKVMSRRLIAIVTIIIVAAVVSCGCSSDRLVKEDLLIRTDIVDIQLGEDVDITNSQKIDLMEYGIVVDNNTIGMSESEKNIKLANGIGVGDTVDKVLSVFGKNLMYDDVKDEETYELVYYYYVKDGIIESVCANLNYNHMNLLAFDKAEREYFDKVLPDMMSSNSYLIKFLIKDDMVEHISMMYSDKSDENTANN